MGNLELEKEIKEVKMVSIVWKDAAFNGSSWSRRGIKDSIGVVQLETIGHLVEEREDCYILAAEHEEDDDSFRHLNIIPKSGIVKVTYLRKVNG